ncbi:MAG TPA: hypothetical protein VIL46_18305 [Gemmataceae bacterium]
MPRAWSKKDERQYEHIKQSYLERGASEERAEEAAARTVNEQRAKEGRTKGPPSGGTGNPNRPLEERTVRELRNLASRRNISGRSHMTKAQLVSALRGRD